MSGSSVVPESLGLEMGAQLGGVDPAHPVVGVGAHHAVLGVLVRMRGACGGGASQRAP